MELYKIVYSEGLKAFGLMTLKPEQRDYRSNIEGYDHPYINFNAAKSSAIADTKALDAGEITIHKCPDCGFYFVFGRDEKIWYEERGWTPPKRCKKCRIGKRNKVNII